MGADGGVTWIRVKDQAHFWELVRPLGFHASLNDGYESYHNAYLDKHPLPGGYAVMPYGTNHEIQGFMDLEAAVEEAMFLRELFRRPDETFHDIMIDIVTMPPDWYTPRGRPGVGALGKCLMEATNLWTYIDLKTLGSAETWT